MHGVRKRCNTVAHMNTHNGAISKSTNIYICKHMHVGRKSAHEGLKEEVWVTYREGGFVVRGLPTKPNVESR